MDALLGVLATSIYDRRCWTECKESVYFIRVHTLSFNLTDELQTAVHAAKVGWEELKRHTADCRVDSAIDRDIKLVADRMADAAILSYLRKHSSHAVLSEESGKTGDSSKEVRWIVDPLDGSFNFYRGISYCAVSIALWQGNQPLLGTILDFATQDLYSGIVGKGAQKNGKTIRVSPTPERSQSVICTGFPVAGNFTENAMAAHLQRMQSFKKVRMLGSAAMSLALVASGVCDLYFEEGIKLWDGAAGIALVLAAGGKVEYHFLEKPDCLSVCASNGLIQLD